MSIVSNWTTPLLQNDEPKVIPRLTKPNPLVSCAAKRRVVKELSRPCLDDQQASGEDDSFALRHDASELELWGQFQGFTAVISDVPLCFNKSLAPRIYNYIFSFPKKKELFELFIQENDDGDAI